MKKTYMTPTLKISKIETESMFATSTTTIGIVSDPNIDDPNDVLAREHKSFFSRSWDPWHTEEDEE